MHMPACAIERPLLVPIPLPDDPRPYPEAADLLGAARRLVLARIEKGEDAAAPPEGRGPAPGPR